MSTSHTRAATLLAMVSVLGGIGGQLLPQLRIDPDAQRGTFGNGDAYPDMCHCALCVKWRRVRRSRSNPTGR